MLHKVPTSLTRVFTFKSSDLTGLWECGFSGIWNWHDAIKWIKFWLKRKYIDSLFLLIFSNVISNKRIIGPIDWTAFFNNIQACKSKNMVTLISTLVLFQCQINFLIFVFQIHWKMSLMDVFCAKFDWNCFSGSEYAGFELRRGYFPLLVLFRKWGEKGVCLRKWWDRCCMRCIVKSYLLTFIEWISISYCE